MWFVLAQQKRNLTSRNPAIKRYIRISEYLECDLLKWWKELPVYCSTFNSCQSSSRPCSNSTTWCESKSWQRVWRALWMWTGKIHSAYSSGSLSKELFASILIWQSAFPLYFINTSQASFLHRPGGDRCWGCTLSRGRQRGTSVLPSWNHNPLFSLCSSWASFSGCQQEVCVCAFVCGACLRSVDVF